MSALIYLAFTLPFLLERYYATIPPIDYAKFTHHSLFGFIAYVTGIITLFGIYLIVLKLLMKENDKIRFVLVGGILFALILTFSYPQTAIDLFVYAIHTRGWARYGLVPFSVSPNALPTSDPWQGLAGEWTNTASPYGPVWEWLSLGAYHLSGGEYLAHLFALKILNVLIYIGCIWLLYRILMLLRPQSAVVGTAFFALNPLVLLEGIQNAHNDLPMVFLFLLSIWGFIILLEGEQGQRRYVTSAVFVLGFAAAILTKYIPLLVLPFFLLGLAARQTTWSRWIFSMILYGLAIMTLVFLVMYPYWPGLDSWAVLYSGKSAGRSLMALMVLALRNKTGTSQAFNIAQISIYAILGGIYLWNLWRVWQQATLNQEEESTNRVNVIIERVLLSSFNVLLGYVLIGVSTFHAWYLLWFLPLAALLTPKMRPMRVSLVFSMASLLIIPYYETIRIWIPSLLQDQLLGHIIGVSLLVIPSLLAIVKSIRQPSRLGSFFV